MIGHVSDASAVAAWVGDDPVLARMPLPDGAPSVCLVGGAVRDALLGAPHGPDVDLVVEGDAIALARTIGRELGGRVVAHERFGTARLEFAHGRHVDMVSARRERYRAPGALPDVEPGSLDDDLARRDFTINAIAYRLSGPDAGALVDPHDGVADLAAGLVRRLRPGSFAEDPSRVVRAVRYAARLGFALEALTAAEAAPVMAVVDLSSPRVGDELRRLLHEDAVEAALALAQSLGAPWPDADPARAARLAGVPSALACDGAPPVPPWALRLGLGLQPQVIAGVAVAGWARAVAMEARAGLALAGDIDAAARPSVVDALLRDRPAAEQVGALVGGATQVGTWWARWRDMSADVDGTDLVAAGVTPGPAIGRALAAVRAAVLDGECGDRDAQLALALSVAAA